MSGLKKLMLVAVASISMTLGARAVLAEDAKPMTGVLIDNMCGDKDANKTADAAMKHKAKCAMKCADSGFQLIVGDKHYKLDDAGNAKAKEYFADEKASSMVTVDGKMADDKITDVTSIKAAEKKEKE
jgi:hypothetical protein